MSILDYCKRNNIYIIAYGKDADKPSAPPGKGVAYFAYDTQKLYFADNSLAWVSVGGGGATQLTDLTDVTSANTAPNLFLATPDGASGYYSGRAIVANDIPSLDASKITSGIFSPARGGTGIDTSAAAAGALLYTSSTGTWSTLSVGTNGQYLQVSGGLPVWGAPPAGGAWELITTITQTSATAQINITGIDSTQYRMLYLRGITACTNTTDTLLMRFNSDTGTNYSYSQVNHAGTAASATGVSSARIAFVTSTAMPKAEGFYVSIYDPDTKNAAYPTILANCIIRNGSSVMYGGSYNVSNASITSIQLLPAASANIEYMYAELYGVK